MGPLTLPPRDIWAALLARSMSKEPARTRGRGLWRSHYQGIFLICSRSYSGGHKVRDFSVLLADKEGASTEARRASPPPHVSPRRRIDPQRTTFLRRGCAVPPPGMLSLIFHEGSIRRGASIKWLSGARGVFHFLCVCSHAAGTGAAARSPELARKWFKFKRGPHFSDILEMLLPGFESVRGLRAVMKSCTRALFIGRLSVAAIYCKLPFVAKDEDMLHSERCFR